MNHKKAITAAVAAAVILALGGTAVFSYLQTQKYRRELEYSYARSLNDLRDSVDSISTTLDKAQYANTATEQNGLAAKLMSESSMAKAAISTLPLTDRSLDNVTRFITQVGDFSMSLAKKISEGQKISNDDEKSMQSLVKYSRTLENDLTSVNPAFSENGINQSLKQTAQDFTNFPSMIYDGPFSDSIGREKPKLTQGKKALSQAAAQKAAAAFLGVPQSGLAHTQDTAGNLPTCNFTAANGNVRISLTRAGGYVASFSNTRSIGGKKLGFGEASRKAQDYLKRHGIRNMKETYYAINDGMCLINYAYQEGKVICYPDLVKVGVALDTGEIVRFQTTGYLMNHQSRKLSPKLTVAQAAKNVSPSLKIKQSRPVLIPTPGLSEVLCYEFLCTGKNNENVLVYINAENGFEENILIMLSTDNGILTR